MRPSSARALASMAKNFPPCGQAEASGKWMNMRLDFLPTASWLGVPARGDVKGPEPRSLPYGRGDGDASPLDRPRRVTLGLAVRARPPDGHASHLRCLRSICAAFRSAAVHKTPARRLAWRTFGNDCRCGIPSRAAVRSRNVARSQPISGWTEKLGSEANELGSHTHD